MSALRDDFFEHCSSGGQGQRSQGGGCEEGRQLEHYPSSATGWVRARGEAIEHYPTARLLIVRKK